MAFHYTSDKPDFEKMLRYKEPVVQAPEPSFFDTGPSQFRYGKKAPARTI